MFQDCAYTWFFLWFRVRSVPTFAWWWWLYYSLLNLSMFGHWTGHRTLLLVAVGLLESCELADYMASTSAGFPRCAVVWWPALDLLFSLSGSSQTKKSSPTSVRSVRVDCGTTTKKGYCVILNCLVVTACSGVLARKIAAANLSGLISCFRGISCISFLCSLEVELRGMAVRTLWRVPFLH